MLGDLLSQRAAALIHNVGQVVEKGIYADNRINKKLGRAGQQYGSERTEKLKRDTTEYRHKRSNGMYHDDRFKIHREIADEIVHSGSRSENPTVVLLLGGSASGKSYLYKTQIKPQVETDGKKFAYLNVDDIKEKLPEYKKFVDEDPHSAAHRVHKESSDIGRLTYEKLVRNKVNFVYDATLSNMGRTMMKIEAFKKAGYNVHLVGVMANLSTVQKAAIARGIRTKRFVPLDIVKEKQMDSRNTFKHLATRYSQEFNSIALYNNSGMLDGNAPILTYHNGKVLDKKAHSLIDKHH